MSSPGLPCHHQVRDESAEARRLEMRTMETETLIQHAEHRRTAMAARVAELEDSVRQTEERVAAEETRLAMSVAAASDADSARVCTFAPSSPPPKWVLGVLGF